MELVQPIRDKKKIEGMKKILASNPRDVLLIILGINNGLRISDLLHMRVSDVLQENRFLVYIVRIIERLL
ncbi:site-specific integrase [Aneurinibacillus migulanus]|uniref:Phage integrase family protein n=1 Tax=Aneurinibacillus migulanus TaxID=47500 RepID=A0A1G8V6I8_ANEMI|nr:hypothetical protein [Aneurinibacillus migulanus]MED0896204.1 hypothetical protein [Aneurinibacillus migulanus]MED1618126.1 hypothetical protein [Aneurinibacillus migulanus]GED17070.1 hypothetical protein AMI01nite_50610 [Aneurinibacillus migulanus]SDJ61702.1 hypothetical protein SAMN04487909_12259 [Aneurinibacillus migulanus]